MIIYIGCRKTTFDDNVMSNYTYQEFYDICYLMPTFQQLPKKERNEKIKEAYGNLKSNAKKSRESGKETESNICDSNAEQLGGDNRAEQSANDGGENIKRAKDKAKVQKQILREEEKKDKS